MSKSRFSRFPVLAASFGLVFATFQASPEDIDIFSVDEAATVNKPNVLIILENSSNWSRAAQHWVDENGNSFTQGQSEARAIKEVINDLPDNAVNVGMLEHRTDGSSGENDGGYIRYHIRPMNASNKADFSVELDQIFNNINEPIEKRSSSNPFGDLFWDAYNYLSGGGVTQAGAGTPASRADSAAYTAQYTNFRSPLATSDSCTRTIIIFVGNNGQGSLTEDSAANLAALAAAGGETTEIPFADYVVTSTPVETALGLSNACYADATACTTAENDAECLDNGFTSCECDADASVGCPSQKFTNVGFTLGSTSTSVVSDTTQSFPDTYTGEALNCSKNAPNQVCTVPPGTVTETNPGPGPNQTTEEQTSWVGGTCAWHDTGVDCGGQKTDWQPRGTKNVRTIIRETTTSGGSQTPLGFGTACFNSLAACAPDHADCGSYDSCACETPTDTTGCPAGGSSQFQVIGNSVNTAAEATGTFSAAPTGRSADEWSRFLRQVGVPIPGTNPVVNSQVTTYTIDVFKDQQNAQYSSYFFNMARVGGGKYYQAKDESQIKTALEEIFTEIQAVNTAFSSASLPVNATNRAQNENQVFIGLFRPDRQKLPKWYGNMKRYQLVASADTIVLGDSNGNPAINNQTGFISDCAVSFWTTDSGDYWQDVGYDNPPAVGICGTGGNPNSDLPDGPFVEKGAAAEVLRKSNNPAASPDGDGNYALSRNMKTIPEGGGALTAFTNTLFRDHDLSTNDAGEQPLVDFLKGHDVLDEDTDAGTTRGTTEPRSTIHGDVVHSRPLPVNYGADDGGVVVYYGSNDGAYRAVSATTGKELWSFIAPEHWSKTPRLFKNTPTIRFHGDMVGLPKDYYFDGASGLYQNADNSDIWIYPSMRRGGRRVYAFDVTDATAPSFMWRKGCMNLTNDTDCDGGMSGIGQTWSLPNVAFVAGYNSGDDPVVIMGGGYDACEDADTASPNCAVAKGKGVYVLDGATGSVLKHFDFTTLGGTPRSAAADVALIDIDFDEKVDYAYAADTGGNIYRMDFIDGPLTRNALPPASWTFSRVAYSNGLGHKFLFAPTVLQASGTIVYVALGSGDREHPLLSQYPCDSDGTTECGGASVLNRFYVFKDLLTDVDPSTSLNLNDANLMVDQSSRSVAEDCITGDAIPVLPSSAEQGWFVDLNEQGPGEQTVTSAVIAAGFVIFSTNRPTLPDSQACTNSLGEARGYFMNLFNASGAIGVEGACGGDRSSEFIGGGLPPSPVIATVPIDGHPKTVVIGAVQKSGDPSAPIEAQKVRPPIRSTRTPVYWYKSTDTD